MAERLTTPSSATPGRVRGCEHGGARRRRGLCRASWRAAQPVTEPVGPQPRSVTERQSPEFAAAEGYAFRLLSSCYLVFRRVNVLFHIGNFFWPFFLGGH